MDLETMKDLLLVKLADKIPVKWLIAHELHADGSPHRHCYLQLTLKVNYRDAKCLDLLSFHGNYQGCRSNRDVLKYCSKKEDWIANFDVEAEKMAREGHKKIIGRKLITKEISLADCVEENPQLLFGLKKLKEDILTYEELIEEREYNKKPDIPQFLDNSWGKWLEMNITVKKRNYWFWSKEFSKGKTFNRKIWTDKYRIQCNPYRDGRWQRVLDSTEAIVFDPYGGKTGSLPWDELEELCNGRGCNINIKGERQQTLKKDLFVIILCNLSIQEVYPFKHNMLSERFILINLD